MHNAFWLAGGAGGEGDGVAFLTIDLKYALWVECYVIFVEL